LGFQFWVNLFSDRQGAEPLK